MLDHGLHPLEHLGTDERFVLAVVLLTHVPHSSGVVRVVEQRQQLGLGDGLSRTLGSGPGSEALLAHGGAEPLERVLAGGVELEGGPDERGALGIDAHGADLVARRGDLSAVEVAERCPTRSTATLGLLREALLYLLSEVA